MENELVIKELVRFCVATHFDKLQFPISKTKLLKFLYKTTNNLPEGNALRKSIPFYWYIHGPYSPPLLQLNKQLLSEEILKENAQGYTATNGRLCVHDDDFQDARKILTGIILESTSTNSTTTIEELYSQDAPYEFYILFKSRFTAMLYNYLYDENTRFKTDKLEYVLHKTVGELPNNSLFSRFKYAYLDYINILVNLTKLELTDVAKQKMYETTTDLFETFARGVRILHHDAYFDSEVSEWKANFEENVNKMEQNIDQLHDLVSALGSKNTNRLSFPALVERILRLKSKDQLVMVSFLPPKNNAELNYGKIDAEFFKKLNDDEFQMLLHKFENSHNAIVHHSSKKELESVTYRLLAS